LSIGSTSTRVVHLILQGLQLPAKAIEITHHKAAYYAKKWCGAVGITDENVMNELKKINDFLAEHPTIMNALP
jgi:hypothetical protein